VRESAHDKARRLLVEGRVRIVSASEDNGLVSAEVRGDSARVYAVSYEPANGGWHCNCPSRGVCSHIRSLMLVVVVRSEGQA
jgi:uncharacterized Zn finger protein